MYEIDLKISAKEDLKNIKEYIFRMSFSINTANKIYNEIMASILTLRIFPLAYPVFKNDLRVLTVRKNYRIFYKVNELKKEVKVYYIFWTEQDYNTLIH